MKKSAVSHQANGLANADGMPMADLAVIEQASSAKLKLNLRIAKGLWYNIAAMEKM